MSDEEQGTWDMVRAARIPHKPHVFEIGLSSGVGACRPTPFKQGLDRLDLNVLRRILKIWKCGCHGMDKFQVLKTPHDLVEVTLERLSNLTIGFLVASTTKQPDFRSLGHPNGLQEAHLVHSLK